MQQPRERGSRCCALTPELHYCGTCTLRHLVRYVITSRMHVWAAGCRPAGRRDRIARSSAKRCLLEKCKLAEDADDTKKRKKNKECQRKMHFFDCIPLIIIIIPSKYALHNPIILHDPSGTLTIYLINLHLPALLSSLPNMVYIIPEICARRSCITCITSSIIIIYIRVCVYIIHA